MVTDEEVMIQGREAAVTKQQVAKPTRNIHTLVLDGITGVLQTEQY